MCIRTTKRTNRGGRCSERRPLLSSGREKTRATEACIDIHAGNIFLREIPQVRINVNTAGTLVPLAQHLNMDLIWIRGVATAPESTLARSLNARGPTLAVEMGIGMRPSSYRDQLITGILSLVFWAYGICRWSS